MGKISAERKFKMVQKILAMKDQGYSNGAIAKALDISESSVRALAKTVGEHR